MPRASCVMFQIQICSYKVIHTRKSKGYLLIFRYKFTICPIENYFKQKL
jgi:hypothetical protein